MKIKKSTDEIIFSVIGYIVLASFSLACLIPFYFILVGSFSKESTIIKNGYAFFLTAENFSLEGYKMVFKSPQLILNAYGITIFVTVVGTAISIFIATMTGYVLSRKDFPWRNRFSFFFFFTTLFSGGLVPYYLLCTQVLHFTNHIYALIIPGAFSVWNMIIAKTFMKGIPFEVVESAKVDGAGDFAIYSRIMLPMSLPLMATIGLFTALGYWNDWYNCMLFQTDINNYNLQYTLQNILNSTEALTQIANKTGQQVAQLPSNSLKMAMTVVATGPIILLYPCLQRFFMKGMTIGAVKG